MGICIPILMSSCPFVVDSCPDNPEDQTMSYVPGQVNYVGVLKDDYNVLEVKLG